MNYRTSNYITGARGASSRGNSQAGMLGIGVRNSILVTVEIILPRKSLRTHLHWSFAVRIVGHGML